MNVFHLDLWSSVVESTIEQGLSITECRAVESQEHLPLQNDIVSLASQSPLERARPLEVDGGQVESKDDLILVSLI